MSDSRPVGRIDDSIDDSGLLGRGGSAAPVARDGTGVQRPAAARPATGRGVEGELRGSRRPAVDDRGLL